jgi:glutamate/tyrosine decarboxylase-like PLP-dependent enzyme
MSDDGQFRVSLHQTPLDVTPEEFRRLGHDLVDDIADFLDALPHRKVTSGASPSAVRAAIGGGSLPERGEPAADALALAARVLFDQSLFTGHPRFWGYIISSASPAGALADLLGAAVNPNVGSFNLSPVATEIESQAVQWVAELLGFPSSGGGLFVSGGNMANFVGFLTARRIKAPWDVRTTGLHGGDRQLVAYVSSETHTWIQKAADLFGLGLQGLRWIPVDDRQRMSVPALEQEIARDRERGHFPFLVVGAAGTVSTGAVDPLADIAAVCRANDLWFHVDGAYGAPAAAVPDAPDDLRALSLADSVAVDPHKWLYAPIEAGCTLVRNPQHLVETFSFHPAYYRFAEIDGEQPRNYYELGPQNSRGFRALKVWIGLRQAGREGHARMIAQDMALARLLYDLCTATPHLEALTHGLSITTFRYVPPQLNTGDAEYLNDLNRAILDRLQAEGEAFLSNAVVDGKFALRVCIVNYRTTRTDIEALPGIVTRVGREVHGALQAQRAGTAAR